MLGGIFGGRKNDEDGEKPSRRSTGNYGLEQVDDWHGTVDSYKDALRRRSEEKLASRTPEKSSRRSQGGNTFRERSGFGRRNAD